VQSGIYKAPKATPMHYGALHSGPMLHDVMRMTTVARLFYSSARWWGFAGQQ